MAPPRRIFHLLLVRTAVMALAPAGVVLWAFGPLAASITGAGVMLLELWRVRTAVRSGVPEMLAFVPSRPADYPWLDPDGFRQELDALAQIGFRTVADYSIDYPNAPKGLARVLVHQELCVYAEVSQVRDRGNITPTTTSLTSMLDDGWSLQTTSLQPLPVAVAFMQAKRSVWRSIPGAPVEELLADHTLLRARMCADLGIRIGGDGTLERYFELQQRGHEARRAALYSTNIVTGIARGIAAERRPAREWFGEYASSRS